MRKYERGGRGKGKGGEAGREGRGRGERDGRESLGGKGGERKRVEKRGGEGKFRGGGGPPQMLFPRTAPQRDRVTLRVIEYYK